MKTHALSRIACLGLPWIAGHRSNCSILAYCEGIYTSLSTARNGEGGMGQLPVVPFPAPTTTPTDPPRYASRPWCKSRQPGKSWVYPTEEHRRVGDKDAGRDAVCCFFSIMSGDQLFVLLVMWRKQVILNLATETYLSYADHVDSAPFINRSRSYTVDPECILLIRTENIYSLVLQYQNLHMISVWFGWCAVDFPVIYSTTALLPCILVLFPLLRKCAGSAFEGQDFTKYITRFIRHGPAPTVQPTRQQSRVMRVLARPCLGKIHGTLFPRTIHSCPRIALHGLQWSS